VHDGVSTECCRIRIQGAAAAPRQALHRDPVLGMDGGPRDENRHRAREAILPLHLDASSAIDLDRGAWKMAVVGPNARRGEIAVKAVVDRFEADGQTGRRPDHAARRNRKQIYEWSEMSYRRDHLNRQVTPQAAVLAAHERGVSWLQLRGSDDLDDR